MDRPSEEIGTLKFQINILTEKLEKAYEAIDAAEYRAQVAEWALVGLGRSKAQTRLSLNSEMLSQATDPMMIADVIGKRLGNELLHGAKIAFNAYSDLYELRMHVMYLENHARGSGLIFKPWEERASTRFPDKSYRPTPFCWP